jgi:methyl-accepting chemotaxis protein
MQLTIKARLILAFAILISLASAIFYLGNSNANELNNWTTTIIKVYAKRIMLSGKIAEDIQLITKREKELIIVTENDVLQDILKEIENRMSDLDSRVDQLKEVSDEAADEEIAVFEVKWQEYIKSYNKIKNLGVIINTDSSNAAAYEVSRTTAKTSAMECVNVMSKIIKRNEKELAKIDEDTNLLYAEGQRNMIILLVISIVMSVAISFWIITSISKSITEAKNAIKAIAEGDLTININTTTKDEIGELLEYLQSMTGKLKEVIGFVTTASDNIASASMQMSFFSQQVSQGATEQHLQQKKYLLLWKRWLLT